MEESAQRMDPAEQDISPLRKRLRQGVQSELRVVPIACAVIELVIYLLEGESMLTTPWLALWVVWMASGWVTLGLLGLRVAYVATGLVHSAAFAMFHFRTWQNPELFMLYNLLAMFVPSGIAAVVPLHPLYFLWVGFVSAGSAALFYWGLSPEPLAEPWMLGLLVGSVIPAILSSRAQRSLARSLGRTRQRLIASERLGVLGQHAAGLAHGLKSPLSAVTHEVYALRDLHQELRESLHHPEVSPEDLEEICCDLKEHLDRLQSRAERSLGLIQSLHERTSDLHQEFTMDFDPRLWAEQALQMVERQAQNLGVRLTMDWSAQAQLHGDPVHLEQVLLNLLQNALDAMEEHPRPEGHIHLHGALHGDQLRILVQDNGPGIPHGLGERIFEPMFTTRQLQNKAGLGLSLCRDVITTSFRGELSLVPSQPGACFELRLPLPLVDQEVGALVQTSASAVAAQARLAG